MKQLVFGVTSKSRSASPSFGPSMFYGMGDICCSCMGFKASFDAAEPRFAPAQCAYGGLPQIMSRNM